jgi:flagellin-specific chaperone FliS
MPFTRGVSGNINGRPFGTPNKVTQEHREFIQSIIDKLKDKIEIELDRLKGKDYIHAITSLLEFVLPKLSRTELKADIQETESCIQIIRLPDNGRDVKN